MSIFIVKAKNLEMPKYLIMNGGSTTQLKVYLNHPFIYKLSIHANCFSKTQVKLSI